MGTKWVIIDLTHIWVRVHQRQINNWPTCSIVLTDSHGWESWRQGATWVFVSVSQTVPAARDMRKYRPLCHSGVPAPDPSSRSHFTQGMGCTLTLLGGLRLSNLFFILNPSPFLYPSSGHPFLRLNSCTLYSAEMISFPNEKS